MDARNAVRRTQMIGLLALFLAVVVPAANADAEAITPSFDRSLGKAGYEPGQFAKPADVAVDENGNFWVVDASEDRVQEFNSEGEFVVRVGAGGPHELSEPAAIAISDGHLWVADTGHNRLEEFDLEGEFIRTVGSYGSEAGELWAPEGIATDGKGHIWVADTANGRIEEFDETGEFIREAGAPQPGESGPLESPTGIAVAPNGDVWVTDWFTGYVVVFNASGEFIKRFGGTGSGEGEFERPDGMAFDERGHAWVLDRGNARVQAFNMAGEYLAQFGAEGSEAGQFSFSGPSGLAIDKEGGIWITDSGNHRLQRWQIPGYRPTYEASFGSGEPAGGELESPAGVARGPDGDIWVLDAEKERLDEFDPKGEFVDDFGEGGSELGQLWDPLALAVDSKGNIWTAEAGGRVQEFNEAGELERSVGKEGEEEGEFIQPEGIAVDAEGNIWIADTYNGRLQELSAKGEVKKILRPEFEEESIFPTGIAVAPDGHLWVAERWGPKVFEIDPTDGAVLQEFGTEGSSPGQFMRASGLLVDSTGNVWVADSWTNRLERFTQNGEFLSQVGASGSGAGQFSLSDPVGLAADEAGELWVADAGNARVQKWKLPGYTAPECQPPNFTMGDDEELTLTTANLRCDGTSPVTFEIATEPEHGGALALAGKESSITYTPKSGFSGVDSFSFVAKNSVGESSLTTVWVEVTGGRPVAVYHFDEGEGSVAHDSARRHDATITGAKWTTGKYGDALEFVAEDKDVLTVPSSRDLQFPNGFTIEAWVEPTSGHPWTPIVTKQGGEGFSYGLFAGGSTEGVPAGYIRSEGELGPGVAGSELEAGIWSYVALTYDGEDLRLYINGELIASHAASPPENSDGALQIGADTFEGHYFDGKIDELSLYNTALTADEVTPDTTPPSTPTEFDAVFEPEEVEVEEEWVEQEEGNTTISWNPSVDSTLPDGYPGSGVASYSYRYRRVGGEWTSWDTTGGASFVVESTTEGEEFEVEVTAVDHARNTSGVGSATLTSTPTELSAEDYGEEEEGESGPAPLEVEEHESGSGEEEWGEEGTAFVPGATEFASFDSSLTGGETLLANEYQERLCGEYPTINPCGRYNGDAAAIYAEEWDLAGTDNSEAIIEHNPNYEYYGGHGGDCTNFASQALKAGGMRFLRAHGENDTYASTGAQASNFLRGVGSWWTYYQVTPLPPSGLFQKTFESSESFIKSEKLYEHLFGYRLIANPNRLKRPRPGDLVFYDLEEPYLGSLDHTQVVVRVTHNRIWVAQHSPGYLHTLAYVVKKNNYPGHELGVDWNFWIMHPVHTAANVGVEIR